ncbi:uncharacterized protein KNAG_0B02860 [Huiozyma naganishii CBS 8797]|uniref:Uncharacterized protein n=1 Tax=Huiozyma naganishii (strain ATCC MYA-139 / BCRC 22969 / CBS 8797 / KCTC 17520 / NBRC 10181 / NCYC 3082 / Yp74L-3) TaxID=1071383 RepID=J7RGR0_HUIN7|nr:hypothetical protein KNAG_0B02860 [Kazachstania naganishii CBS 8797]CCK68728.1 hypothetical protein KNAG_0B02860 [Kazachstania naganishii CBS 8797]
MSLNVRSVNKVESLPGTNIPTIRELVKAKQNQRKEPVTSKFLGRVEDNLIKWNPSISSHNGTIQAVEGIHPFQTAKTSQVDNETHSQLPQGSGKWYKENSEYLLRQLPSGGFSDVVLPDEDSFVLPTSNPATTATPFAIPAPDTETAGIEKPKEAYKLKDNNARGKPLHQDPYSIFYQRPVPVNYIQHEVNIRNMGVAQNQEGTDGDEQYKRSWLATCINWIPCNE